MTIKLPFFKKKYLKKKPDRAQIAAQLSFMKDAADAGRARRKRELEKMSNLDDFLDERYKETQDFANYNQCPKCCAPISEMSRHPARLLVYCSSCGYIGKFNMKQ